jgi:hypothetical protein
MNFPTIVWCFWECYNAIFIIQENRTWTGEWLWWVVYEEGFEIRVSIANQAGNSTLLKVSILLQESKIHVDWYARIISSIISNTYIKHKELYTFFILADGLFIVFDFLSIAFTKQHFKHSARDNIKNGRNHEGHFIILRRRFDSRVQK